MSAGEYALPLSIILCSLIIFVESFRHKKKFHIDLLFGISLIYIICFGIVPIFIFTVDLSYYPSTHLIRKVPLDDPAYLLASITSLIGYVIIIIGYHFAKKFRFYKNNDVRASRKTLKITSYYSEKKVVSIGIFLFILGSISLFVYVNSIGGIRHALETATLYRSGIRPISSKWLFLKNLAPIVMVSSYFFFALIYYKRNKYRKFYIFMFILSFLISLYLQMLLSGRLSMVSYLVIFPLFIVIYRNKATGRFIVISAALSLLFIVFGNAIFSAFSNPEQFFYYLASWKFEIDEIIRSVLTEFSFPYINIVNLLVDNRIISFRFFIDVFIGILTLLPQSLIGIQTPDTLSKINTSYFETFGTIPVDLLSFGYYSFSIPGIIIVTFSFGIIVFLFDNLFPSKMGPIESIFRAAWIVFLSFRVMYGDPGLVLQGGFELFVGTILLLLIRKKVIESSIKIDKGS